jgi:hypothetical protein
LLHLCGQELELFHVTACASICVEWGLQLDGGKII